MGEMLSNSMEWIRGVLTEIGQGNVVLALLATALLIVLGTLFLFVLRRIFRRLDRRVESWEGTRLRAVQLQKQELLSAEDTTTIARGVVRWIGYVVYAVLVYTVLQLIFVSFPATRPVGTRLLATLADAAASIGAAVVDYLPNIAFLAVLYFLATRAVKLIQLIFRGIQIGRIKIRGFEREWAKPTSKLVVFLIWVFFLVVAFPYLPGSNSPAFQGVSIFLGVLLSLGSTGAAANLVSGIVLTYTRAFRIGDQVLIGETRGVVVDRTLFVTRLRTPKLAVITVPNSMVMNAHVENYSTEARERGVYVHSTVTVGYEVPWRQVHELLLGAAENTEGIETEPAPFVHQTSLDDFSVSYELNAATKTPGIIPKISSALHANIQDRFHEAGIEIASPHFYALRDGNQPAIPADKSPPTTPGAFRFLGLGTQG